MKSKTEQESKAHFERLAARQIMPEDLDEAPQFTLSQLAAKHNMFAPRAIDGCEFKAPHAAASAMHGWRRYEYHYGDFMLSDADYLAALEAASTNSVHLPAVAPQKI